ncbi:HNH endonuclease [Streptomyces sp. V1I6]|uniref:HNH endonuclease signature motif containing protein n=1 Tax=Streptomyces sp. V1I6 TaxID=3042273 RepID=UPI002783FCC3|nr:HNH endonuclease [Streptomyces sp. V1I6]MDQ0843035.1 5-methylcytosine-specific restriction endonuclease McrA [Streptomyces sp. V1I6]
MAVSPYTRERLSEAARSSRTLSEALGKLGVDPKNKARRAYLRDRFRRLGVSTSHFEREGHRWSRERLDAAVRKSTNMCQVLRALGLDVLGGQHTHISRRIRALGIDTSHFASRARTERMRTNSRRLSAAEILVRKPVDDTKRTSNQLLKRALTESGVAQSCALCGLDAAWQGCLLPLEVDHIDGDWRNNRLDNLRLLCPNCHSSTDTYRGRKRGLHPTGRQPR